MFGQKFGQMVGQIFGRIFGQIFDQIFDALDLDTLETFDIFQSCFNAASIIIPSKFYEREGGIRWLSENLNYHSGPNEIHTSLT